MLRYKAKVKRTANFIQVKATIERKGGKIILTSEQCRSVSFEATESSAASIKALPGVESVQLDQQYTPDL